MTVPALRSLCIPPRCYRVTYKAGSVTRSHPVEPVLQEEAIALAKALIRSGKARSAAVVAVFERSTMEIHHFNAEPTAVRKASR